MNLLILSPWPRFRQPTNRTIRLERGSRNCGTDKLPPFAPYNNFYMHRHRLILIAIPWSTHHHHHHHRSIHHPRTIEIHILYKNPTNHKNNSPLLIGSSTATVPLVVVANSFIASRFIVIDGGGRGGKGRTWGLVTLGVVEM